MKLNARNSFSLKSDTNETGGIIKIIRTCSWEFKEWYNSNFKLK